MKVGTRPTLRRARAGEAAAILELLLAAFAQYRDKLQPESGTFRESEETIADRLAKESCVVAEAAGRFVGAIFFADKGDHLYLSRLSVLPEWRGRGLAGRLIGAVEAAAHAQGRQRVALGVRIALPGNIALFERLGYRAKEREQVPPTVLTSAEFRSLCPASAICMAKDLTSAKSARP